jgi:hypothetical protein
MSKSKTKFTRENGKTVTSEFIYVNEMFDHAMAKGKQRNTDIHSTQVAFDNEKATDLAFALISGSLLEVMIQKPVTKAAGA